MVSEPQDAYRRLLQALDERARALNDARVQQTAVNELLKVIRRGAFELQPPDDKEFLEELDEPTEGLLMEAMRQLDEIT